MTGEELIKRAKNVIQIEADSVKALIERIDENFVRAVDILYHCKGRVIVVGMGKSGIIARKIASTMASTGTPALFLHPAEGVHGDLGTVVVFDTVVIISNSGETKEIIEILPSIKRIGVKVIALTGKIDSTLGKTSDVAVDVSVKEEACPLGLAPTASTSAQLAMGDALAVALLVKRDFKPEDYAMLHPAGSLGRGLLKVEDIMRKGKDIPVVAENLPVKKVILEITSKKMGCTTVVNTSGEMTGIITDQDLRNHMKSDNFFKFKAKDIMTKNPKTISRNSLVHEAIRITEERSVTTLLIVDEKKRPLGVIHLHDLLKLTK